MRLLVRVCKSSRYTITIFEGAISQNKGQLLYSLRLLSYETRAARGETRDALVKYTISLPSYVTLLVWKKISGWPRVALKFRSALELGGVRGHRDIGCDWRVQVYSMGVV